MMVTDLHPFSFVRLCTRKVCFVDRFLADNCDFKLDVSNLEWSISKWASLYFQNDR